MLLIRCIHPSRGTHDARVLCLLFVLPMLVIGLIRYAGARRRAPDERQRIAATLVSWGVGIDGLSIPLSQEKIDQQVELLRSDISEVRVQAADWLASRGLRDTGVNITLAMNDPGTLRPCQLAMSLGSLGDQRWTDLLVQATRHPSNADLRVCATHALGKLQSPEAQSALIEVYRRDVAPTSALNTLGKIAAPSSLVFLRSVADRPRNEIERKTALHAITRVQTMQQPDVAAALISLVRLAAARGGVDEWAVRKLANLGDPRAVAALGNALKVVAEDDCRVVLAAALLACGDAGIQTLRTLADPGERAASTSAIAHAALMLVQPAEPIVWVRRGAEHPRDVVHDLAKLNLQ